MNDDLTDQLKEKVEKALFETLRSEQRSDLYQLLKNYQIIKALELRLVSFLNIPPPETCCFHDGLVVYGECECNNISKPPLTREKSQEFCEKIAPKLESTISRLSQVIKEVQANVEIILSIDPDINEQDTDISSQQSLKKIPCKWVCRRNSSGNLICKLECTFPP